MNKRQVIVLWIVAIALSAAVVVVKLNQTTSTASITKRAAGQTLFEAFPADEVATIEIQGAQNAVTLAKAEGGWTVSQRDNYPANNANANELLRTVADLKVTQGIEAGPSFAPRFGMDPDSKDPVQHGIIARFKDASGKELEVITLGKSLESTASASPMGGGSTGRFIRNHADASGFYAVSEAFPTLSDDPRRWLADAFISPEKIQSIAVSEPGQTELAWKVTRTREDGEFALDGATAGETLDPQAAAAFNSLFSFARFQDVIPAVEAEKRGVADQTRILTLQTFEGFTYTLTLTPSKSVDAGASAENTPPSETYLLTVEVTAELPTERQKPEGETEEDAKTQDETFKTRRETLEKKLTAEKGYAGRIFEIPSTTVDPLLKNRADLLKKETPGENAGQPGSPGGIQATTPPIPLPGAGE